MDPRRVLFYGCGVPKGIRTPVAAVKGRSPRPLDDGDTGLNQKIGGARRDRTADLNTASVALSQLSYGPGKGAYSKGCSERNQELFHQAFWKNSTAFSMRSNVLSLPTSATTESIEGVLADPDTAILRGCAICGNLRLLS